MRLLAIGDIHGCLRAFNALLDAVAPAPDDQIVALGDYVDRGPDSRGVLDRLLALQPTGRLVALLGNHDLMLLDARHGRDLGWLSVGGKETLLSYGVPEWKIDDLTKDGDWFGDPETFLGRIPDRHWQFLEEDCLPYFETEKHIFVHANLYPHLSLDKQPEYMLYWEKMDHPCDHYSGKIVICGHTRQKSGWPLDLGTAICIDTGVYGGGWLTCFDVYSGRIWQANERDEVRTGWLNDGRTEG